MQLLQCFNPSCSGISQISEGFHTQSFILKTYTKITPVCGYPVDEDILWIRWVKGECYDSCKQTNLP